MTNQPKVSFQNTNKEVTATRGLKLKNKNAEKKEQEKIEREQYKEKFEKSADQAVQNYEDKNKKALEVISKFMRLSEDKTLSKNKGYIGIDVEKEIRQELIQLVIDLDNDESESEYGKGSVVAISILSKIVLNLRDRINDLEFEISSLKNGIKRN